MTLSRKLLIAIRDGDVDDIIACLAEGAKLSETLCFFSPDSKLGMNALHVAAYLNNPEKINFMLKSNTALINEPTTTKFDSTQLPTLLTMNMIGLDVETAGLTPLHFAILANAVDAVECLVNNEADKNLRTSRGNTSLHLAIQCCPMAIPILVEKGSKSIDINAVNLDNDTPCSLAQHLNKSVIGYLKSKGAKLTSELVQNQILYRYGNSSFIASGLPPIGFSESLIQAKSDEQTRVRSRM